MTASATVATLVRTTREQRGLSQQELAALMDNNQSFVSRIESSKGVNLTLETLESVAAAFGLRLHIEFKE